MRFRNVCFTLNNPTDVELDFIANLHLSTQIRYFVAQLEIGTGNETLHLQGYLELMEGMTPSAVKTLMGSIRFHLEARKGTAKEAADYCKKADTRWQAVGNQTTQWEWGTISKQVLPVEENKFSYPCGY